MKASVHPAGPDLMAYLDDELDQERVKEIEVHCAECSECREILDSFKGVQLRLDSEGPLPLPQPVWPAVEKELRGDRPLRFGPAFGFGTAAACAAGLVLGLLMGEPALMEGINQETAAWASTDYLWSSSDDSTLLNAFSVDQTVERAGES